VTDIDFVNIYTVLFLRKCHCS